MIEHSSGKISTQNRDETNKKQFHNLIDLSIKRPSVKILLMLSNQKIDSPQKNKILSKIFVEIEKLDENSTKGWISFLLVDLGFDRHCILKEDDQVEM